MKPAAAARSWGTFHTSPLRTRQGPSFQPMSPSVIWAELSLHPLSLPRCCVAEGQERAASVNSQSTGCFTGCHCLGRRKRKEGRRRATKHARGWSEGLSVPISCELPHMKGRNWKSSRPHTPWLPAGSILYVFWSFRITSRYLHRGMGKRAEVGKLQRQSQLFYHWEHREAGNSHLRVTGLSFSENLRAQVMISWHFPNNMALCFPPTLCLLVAPAQGKTLPGQGG